MKLKNSRVFPAALRRPESRTPRLTVTPPGNRKQAKPTELTVIIFLSDIVRADERGQSPHVPLEDALVHRVERGAAASVCDHSRGVAAQAGRGRAGGGHRVVLQRGRGSGAGRGGRLQLQPVVVVVAENLMAGLAALAAARPASAPGEGAAESGRRLLLAGLQHVPVLFAGLVVPPQGADLLPGHRRRDAQDGLREAHRGPSRSSGGGALRLERRPRPSHAA